MNRPPLPADNSPMHAHRLEQSLTCLAPGVSGAALLPVHPRIRRSEPRFLANETNVAVKLVQISFCTSVFTSLFTLLLCNLRTRNQLQMPLRKKVQKKIHQNGREEPAFSASNRPKSL